MDAPNAADGSIPADNPTHDSVPADGSMSADMSGDDDATADAVLRMQRIWRGRFLRAESDLGAAFFKVVAEATSLSSDSAPTSSKQPIRERETFSLKKATSLTAQREATRDAGSSMRSWRTAARQPLFARKLEQPQQNSLSQGWFDSGNLAAARLVDDVLLAPLVYRLVALNPSKAWGKGKLVQLAEKPISDEELAQELSALLLRPWKDDPTRTCELKDGGWNTTQEYTGVRRNTQHYLSIAKERLANPNHAGLLAASAVGRHDSGDTDPDGETWGDVLLEGRGSVGETVLHLAFLLNTPACRRLVRFLVPCLANEKTTDLFGHKVGALDATYLGQPYFGEVAAHFAIVHEDLPMLKLLVAHGASLAARANGDFFYSSPLVYFGGTLLGFAACLDNKPIVEYLLTNECIRANPNGRDLGAESKRGKRGRVRDDTAVPRNGLQTHMHRDNTILHCLVLHERAHMFRYLVSYGANPYSFNCMNQTPMLLAVAMGSRKMVSTVMEATQVVAWTFGPMQCVEIPLYEVERAKETKVIAEEEKARQPAWAVTKPRTILQLIDRESQTDLLCKPHAAADPEHHMHMHSPDACLSACLGRHRFSVDGAQSQMGLLCLLNISLLCHVELILTHLADARAMHDTRWGPLHRSRLPIRCAVAD